MGNPVAIIGSGQTRHGRRSELTYPDLIREAVDAALADAGIDHRELDGVVYGSMPSMMEGVALTHFYFADALRAVGKPMLKTETCGTTGMSLAITGYYWVASGMADLVLVVGSEKMHEGDGQAVMSSAWEPFYLRHIMVGAPGLFSLQAQEWSVRYNLPEQKVRDAASTISVNHHKNAFDNPYAHVKANLSMEDVSNARVITYPVRLWDVCPTSDGACAVIFASQKMAKKLSKNPVWVKGVGFCGDEYWYGDGDKILYESAVNAAKDAYDMAGIKNPRKELDVAEIYDPFSYVEMLHYECFGFAERGKVCDDVLRGVFGRGGELPCCPSGGVLCTNPIGATALVRVAEAALQVSGKAEARQVGGAKLALAHGMGGAAMFNGVMILGSKL